MESLVVDRDDGRVKDNVLVVPSNMMPSNMVEAVGNAEGVCSVSALSNGAVSSVLGSNNAMALDDLDRAVRVPFFGKSVRALESQATSAMVTEGRRAAEVVWWVAPWVPALAILIGVSLFMMAIGVPLGWVGTILKWGGSFFLKVAAGLSALLAN